MSTGDPILGVSLDDLRRTRSSVKWRAFPGDVLPVWVAEMDSRPCPAVVTAVRDALDRGDTGYSWPAAYLQAVAQFERDRFGWRAEPEAMLSVADVMVGIEQLLHRYVPREAAVVVSTPCYDAFYDVIALVGRRLVTARLGTDHRLDLDALDRAFADAGPGGAYLLCNPHNPTGTLHTAAELAALARLADEHRILVISDEIHAPLVQPSATFTPYLSVAEAVGGVAVLSASKAWNLAGLKAAALAAGPEARDLLTGMPKVIGHATNHLAVIAHTAAFSDGIGWLDQLLGEIADRRALAERLLTELLPAVSAAPAEATYLAWLDCRQLGLADPAAVFRAKGRVALSPGTAYDRDGGRGWARLNLATSESVLTEAVRRMASAVA